MFPGYHETGLSDVRVVPEFRRSQIRRDAYTQRFKGMGQFFARLCRDYLAESCDQVSILLVWPVALILELEGPQGRESSKLSHPLPSLFVRAVNVDPAI
jgi:hypothetical protein